MSTRISCCFLISSLFSRIIAVSLPLHLSSYTLPVHWCNFSQFQRTYLGLHLHVCFCVWPKGGTVRAYSSYGSILAHQTLQTVDTFGEFLACQKTFRFQNLGISFGSILQFWKICRWIITHTVASRIGLPLINCTQKSKLLTQTN